MRELAAYSMSHDTVGLIIQASGTPTEISFGIPGQTRIVGRGDGCIEMHVTSYLPPLFIRAI